MSCDNAMENIMMLGWHISTFLFYVYFTTSSFSRFTKLFCVMGVSWIFEILSWQVDGLGFFWYWNIFDIFNILSESAAFFRKIYEYGIFWCNLHYCSRQKFVQLVKLY